MAGVLQAMHVTKQLLRAPGTSQRAYGICRIIGNVKRAENAMTYRRPRSTTGNTGL